MVTYCCVFYLSHILKEKKISPTLKQLDMENPKTFMYWTMGFFLSWKVVQSALICTWFLISCVEFWELFHLTCDLSQAEKKIKIVANEQVHKTTSISLKMVEVVILRENSCHFVCCSVCNNSYFLLSLR